MSGVIPSCIPCYIYIQLYIYISYRGSKLIQLPVETTVMLANLATEPEAKRILTAGVFSMDTRTSVMMNVTV